jgi:hypothetical protein
MEECGQLQARVALPLEKKPPEAIGQEVGWTPRAGLDDMKKKERKKLHGLSPRTNYTDRATAACQRSDSQLFADGAT